MPICVAKEFLLGHLFLIAPTHMLSNPNKMNGKITSLTEFCIMIPPFLKVFQNVQSHDLKI